MTTNDQSSRSTDVTDDDVVGKIFIALADDMRQCVTCEKVFPRNQSFEHSNFPCYPKRFGSTL